LVSGLENTGAGIDTFSGGTGFDKYEYFHTNEAGDTYTDFESEMDQIHVLSNRWGDLDSGMLDINHFNYDFID